MTAACITFEQIENRTENSLALAIAAKRASQNALAAVTGNAILLLLAASLRNLVEALSTESLERMTEGQLNALSVRLGELLPRMKALCSAINRTHSRRLLWPTLVSTVRDTTEELESVLENIRFALRPDFQHAINSAVGRLNIAERSTAHEAMLHRLEK
jgi:hypothetical protein